MLNLLGRLTMLHRRFILACALVLGLFQFLFCALVAEMDLENAIAEILAFAPPAMRTVIEQSLLGGSAAGVLAFGWNHPITLALLTAVAIAPAARAIAGETEHGAIELVLAQPISRSSYLTAHVLFGAAAIVFVAATGALGTLIGLRVFSLEAFTAERVLQLLLNVVLLQAAVYAATLLVSAVGREGGRAAATGVLIALISYLVNVIATLWPKAAWLEPYSLHSYYNPRAILVNGQLGTVALLVLTLFTAAATISAYWRFSTRDLP